MAHPDWTWIGYGMMALGAIPLLAVALSLLPESAIPSLTLRKLLKGDGMADEEKQGISITSHHQQGGITAHTVNVQAPSRFELTEAHMTEIALNLDKTKPVVVTFIGDQHSHAASVMLATFLETQGFSVRQMPGTMMAMPPLPHPIEINRALNQVTVDTSR